MTYPAGDEHVMWARSLVREHGIGFGEAVRRSTLQARVPRLDRLLGDRYAGAEFSLPDGTYHLWVTAPVDAEIVGVVTAHMREASVADDEWAIHAARFNRRALRAAQSEIADVVRATREAGAEVPEHEAALATILSIGGDVRRGVVEVVVLHGTPAATIRTLAAMLPDTAVPAEVVEGESDTHPRPAAVSIEAFYRDPYVPDEQALAWARALMWEHDVDLDEALRRATLQGRVPRLDRVLGDRFAGAEFSDAHTSYHLLVTRPVDAEIVEFVAERMRAASVAEDEWAIHGVRFGRRVLQAAHDAINPSVWEAAPGVVQMTSTDPRIGAVVVSVLRGTAPEVIAAIRAAAPANAVPLEFIEVDKTTAVAGAARIARSHEDRDACARPRTG